MGNSQYRRQHYITYHGYKYSLPSVAGFSLQSGDYYLFPLPKISGGQGSERVKSIVVGPYLGQCQEFIVNCQGARIADKLVQKHD